VSYVIGIQRIGGTPLSEEEMKRALNGDGAFRQVTNASWVWTDSPEGIELYINLAKDHLWTDGSRSWTATEALRALNRVAATIDARVIGEENEDLTGVDMPRQTDPERKPTRMESVFAILVLLPLFALVGLMRLPSNLWRLVRRK